MLLKSHRNLLFEILKDAGINMMLAEESYYRIDIVDNEANYIFYVSLAREDSFNISFYPGNDFSRDDFFVEKWDEVVECFSGWVE